MLYLLDSTCLIRIPADATFVDSSIMTHIFSLGVLLGTPAIWARSWGGGVQMGLVHNLLMLFFTMGSSKIEVSETRFFDMVIT